MASGMRGPPVNVRLVTRFWGDLGKCDFNIHVFAQKCPYK